MDKKYNQGVADSNKRRTKHGQCAGARGTPERNATTKEYTAWSSMKDRCFNPNNTHYARYGGRGIKVCDEWRDSFETFYKDVGIAPSKKHSLDKINNDGDYSPDNTRWATKQEQANNRTTNVFIEHDGTHKTWADWARHLDIPYDMLMTRVARGNSIEDILQPRLNRERNELVEFKGESHTLREWAVISGVKYQTLWYRFNTNKDLF